MYILLTAALTLLPVAQEKDKEHPLVTVAKASLPDVNKPFTVSGPGTLQLYSGQYSEIYVTVNFSAGYNQTVTVTLPSSLSTWAILLTPNTASSCACSATTSASADRLAELAATSVTRHIRSLERHSLQVKMATSNAAKPVTDPLSCGDCASVICRVCGTPLESSDELAIG